MAESGEVAFRLPKPQALELAERAVQEAEDMLVNQGIKAIEDLVGGMNSGMKTKQTELQLMVGSRYHELIESADHIVTMRDNVVHVARSLQDVGDEVSSICERIQERHQKSLSALLDATESVDSVSSTLPPLQTTLTILGLPAVSKLDELEQRGDALVWDLMDKKRFVAAAYLVAAQSSGHPLRSVVAMEAQACLLEASGGSAAASASESHEDGGDGTEWDMRVREDVQDASESLAAMVLLARADGSPVSFVEMYLEIRRGHVQQLLHDILPAESPAVEEVAEQRFQQDVDVLVRALEVIQASVLVVHGLCGGLVRDDAAVDPHTLLTSLQELLDGSSNDFSAQVKQLAARFGNVSPEHRKHVVRSLTTWLAEMCRLMFETSKDFMLSLTSSSTPTSLLAQLQSQLRSVLNRGPRAEQRWNEACSAVVDETLLQELLEPGDFRAASIRSPHHRSKTGRVDLWSAIFGSTVTQIIGTLTTKAVDVYVDRIVDALDDLRGACLAAADSKTPVFSAGQTAQLTGAFQDRSERLIEQLRRKCQDITQPGSESAKKKVEQFPEHLVDLLCTKLVCIMHWFRAFSTPQCGGGGGGVGGGDAQRLPSCVTLALARALYGFVYENDKLRGILRPDVAPQKKRGGRPRRNRASPQQLRASFDIADTDGDSYINTAECMDALEAVCPASVDINSLRGYINDDRIDGRRISFNDFALLCASILDGDLESSSGGSRWDAHVVPEMTELLVLHLQKCSEDVLERPFAALKTAYGKAKVMAQVVDDQGWRRHYQNWQCIKVKSGNAEVDEPDADDGYEEQLWFPCTATFPLVRLLLTFTRLHHMATPLSDNLQLGLGSRRDAEPSFSSYLNGAFGTTLRHQLSVVAKEVKSALRGGRTCESFLLQMTLDWSVAEACLEHFQAAQAEREGELARLSPSQVREKCVDAIDPINWQLYEATMKMLSAESLASLAKLVGLSGTQPAAAPSARQSQRFRASKVDAVGLVGSDQEADSSSGLQHALATAGRVKRLGVLAIPMRTGPARRAGSFEASSKQAMDGGNDSKSAFANAFSAFFGQTKAS
uniref:Conserved oligomeric Golgi complex subunit 1 n=1 Tax=Pinguiococcus pyrenoidosus TaxID=172671 RepID=A0A7R9YE28_9STRA|mmetsp:Transcript_5898/g.22880  ORF Transcript_5898/g.22880 Transcript_5898/m.22880 type:complete len:1065 (+) Transcript_5898:251-3445(+)